MIESRKIKQYIFDASAPDVNKNFTVEGALPHLVASRIMRFLVADLSSAIFTSSSSGTCSSSARLELTVLSTKYIAARRAKDCDAEATPKATVDKDEYNTFTPAFNWNAPAKTQGATKPIIGKVPICIWIKESFNIPVKTDVGQSGPPHNMLTLAIPIPGFSNIILMARMEIEFTPTICLTQTFVPNFSPKNFCCIATAAVSLIKNTPSKCKQYQAKTQTKPPRSPPTVHPR